MRKTIICILFLVVVVSFPLVIHASGDNGYEAGISSGYVEGSEEFDYSEVVFISGKPIELKGDLTIKKSLRQNELKSTYTYVLYNTDENTTLRRVLNYNTLIEKKPNGQTIEKTSFSRVPVETIDIGDDRYVLETFDFSQSNIIDHKPSVDYSAGNVWSRKIYRVGGINGDRITLEIMGEKYNCKHYWGSVESGSYDLFISRSGNDNWGGTAKVKYSSSATKEVSYVNNLPNQISFGGGDLLIQKNSSILNYEAFLPEFDSKGTSTDNLNNYTGSMSIETFPVQTRLIVPNLLNIRGHWAENDIRKLYSLEVLNGVPSHFMPEQIMSRAEFISAAVAAAPKVPVDPRMISRINTSRRNAKSEIIASPFVDIPINHIYYSEILDAFNRRLINGTGNNRFTPYGTLTTASAITIFIRALGLESMGPGEKAVTNFRDNYLIPNYARNSVYVASQIGIVSADSKGNLNPNKSLTKASAAIMLNKFIDYMKEDLLEDYIKTVVK